MGEHICPWYERGSGPGRELVNTVLRFLSNVLFMLGEVIRAPFDAITGKRNRTYAVELDVAAPKDVTWAVASAHNIRLEGLPPIELAVTPDPARPSVYTGYLKVADRELALAYRVLEERPGEAMLIELLKDESAPECCPGDNYVCAVAVSGEDGAPHSTVTATYQITHTKLSSRFLMPIAAVQNTGRIKRNAELRAGTIRDDVSSQIKNAVLTGALTFGSFFAMFGASDAAMLVFVILLHELGHVIAMRWAGIPVKGIYFVPFFGGVAVGASSYKSEVERGLVALMGPGFSILTTALFAYFAIQNQDETMRNLAFMSAIINGFNLLPFMPLDGGHVMQSLLSRAPPEFSRGFHGLALLAGGALALFLETYVLVAILFLIAPTVLNARAGAKQLPPLSRDQAATLLVAYVATFVFYVAISLQLPQPDTETQHQDPAQLGEVN